MRGGLAWAGTTALVMLAAWVGLLGIVRADEWTEGRFLAHMQRYLPRSDTSDVVLVRAEAGGPLGSPGPGWRGAHAEMVDALAAAGARVVVFDAYFEEPSEHDGRLAEAITRAQPAARRSCSACRAFEVSDGRAVPTMTRALAASPARWGTLSGDSTSRRLELARILEDSPAARGGSTPTRSPSCLRSRCRRSCSTTRVRRSVRRCCAAATT